MLNENLGSEALTGCETGHTCHIVTLMKPVIQRQALSFIFYNKLFELPSSSVAAIVVDYYDCYCRRLYIVISSRTNPDNPM